MQSLKKLKTLLQSNGGLFFYNALIISAFLIMIYDIIYVFLFAIILIIFRKRKEIIIISSIFIFFILISAIFIKTYKTKEFTSFSGVVARKEESYLDVKKGWYYVRVYTNEDYHEGDYIFLTGKLFTSYTKKIKHQFLYLGYLDSLKIYFEFKPSKIIKEEQKFSLFLIKGKIKTYLLNFSQEIRPYLEMLILGDNNLDDETYSNIKDLGIVYLFAISGLHISILISFIKKIIPKFIPREIVDFLIILFLLAYLSICFSSVSLKRAILFYLFLTVRKVFKIKISRLDTVSLTYIVMVILNPFLIYNSGFILSTIAIFVLVLGSNYLKNDEMSLKSSILITLYTLPVILSMNGKISLFVIFFQVIYNVYLLKIMIPLGYLTFLFPYLEIIYKNVILFFIKTVDILKEVNVFINFNFTSLLIILIYYLIITLALSKKIKIEKAIFSVFILITLNLFIPNYSIPTSVSFLDVGQGDSIFIKSKSCKMLIDTGDVDEYNSLVNYLLKENINELTYLVITHNHNDHMGELDDLKDNFKIKKIIDNQTNIVNFNCGEMSFKVLNSQNNNINENNNSLVLYGKVKNFSYLFAGDIEKEAEKELIKYNLKVDILKVAHHGSSTSSSEEFIENIKPKLAIITCGENNYYNFPHEQVTERLKKHKINYYITGNDGTITFSTFFNYFCIIKNTSAYNNGGLIVRRFWRLMFI